MKPFLMMAAVLATGLVYAQNTKSPRKVEREGYVVTIPAGWSELPEVANESKNAVLGTSTDMTGDAIAFGDTKVGVMAVVVNATNKNKVPNVRAALEAFHDEVKGSLGDNGITLSSYTREETTTRMSAALAGSDKSVDVKGRMVAVVGKDGRITSFSAQCFHAVAAKKKAAPLCDAFLASFDLTIPDDQLKLIEKKAK